MLHPGPTRIGTEVRRVMIVTTVEGLGTDASICREVRRYYLLPAGEGHPELIATHDPCPEGGERG